MAIQMISFTRDQDHTQSSLQLFWEYLKASFEILAFYKR
ncbi:unnamed protein product [Paramecium octaurelia]|uniref:Uncharacterized protein n=1 Tax=Paramecium octaurelia TaxID=43137 RepID=A0A8S1TUA2_PAROT|nr:unnamed protein product [Paramecium octaurelia]